MEADNDAGTSNSSDPPKPPERILADFGDKEVAMKDLIKKALPRDFSRILPIALEYIDDHLNISHNYRYYRALNDLKALEFTVEGRALSEHYKIRKRYVHFFVAKLVSLSPADCSFLFSLVLPFYKSRQPTSVPSSDDIYEFLLELKAEAIGDDESYAPVLMNLIKGNNISDAIRLAQVANHHEDVLMIIAKFNLAKFELSKKPLFLIAFSEYINKASKSAWWTSSFKPCLLQLKELPPERLASMFTRLSTAPLINDRYDLGQFLVYFAFHLVNDRELRRYALLLINSGLLCLKTVGSFDISLEATSKICEFLNSFDLTMVDSNPPQFLIRSLSLEEYFRVDKLSNGALLSLIVDSCKTELVGYHIRYKNGVFGLGTKYLPAAKAAEPETIKPTTESTITRSDSVDKLAMDLQVLLERKKQIMSSRAQSLTEDISSDCFDLAEARFVIDTNVLITAPRIFERFLGIEAEIIIPIVVLEELVSLSDSPIKGKSCRAVEALDWLDKFHSTGNVLKLKSMAASGKISGSFACKSEICSLGTVSNDDLILKMSLHLINKHLQHARYPVVVSDDINMRLKAKAMGIRAINLETFTSATFIKP